ncbi:type I 3-dehydroquinate dehydratase [Lentilactobacillus hilgardii]|uniref:type I 3-dehydroquinate dehydratase n=1 Tax=Lentilactobacillus hilgardii TaxID=1588 RepID=UPI003FA5ED64
MMAGKIIQVKHTTFESGKTNIAVPITGKISTDIISQVKQALNHHPDVIEWRIDYDRNVLDHENYLDTVDHILSLIGNTPLLTTFRTAHEGGVSSLEDAEYFSTYRWLLENRLTDMLDIELNRNKATVDFLINLAHHQNIPVILSNHDFQSTPDETEIISKLKRMQERNADIGKIAVMPHTSKDVLTLLNATEKANRELEIPIITMSMGNLGKVSRVTGPLFGSTLSFATVAEASAPGQLTVEAVRKGMATLN